MPSRGKSQLALICGLHHRPLLVLLSEDVNMPKTPSAISPSPVYLSAGITEAGLQAALDALPDGGKLVLAANSVVQVSSGLVIDATKSVTIDLNGSTLKQAGNVNVVTIKGRHDASASVTPGTASADSLTVTMAQDAKGNLLVTQEGTGTLAPVQSPLNLAVGSWVKIYADDELSYDHGSSTRMGQALQITAIDGNKVTLGGALIDASSYSKNVRISGYSSGTVAFTNGTVQGDQSHPDWTTNLVEVRATIGTQISNIIVRDGNSMGINVVDSVNTSIKQSAAINLTDNVDVGSYGYGVHSASSWGTTVDGFYAQNVRHAVDDNAVGLSAAVNNASKYGADYHLTATNVVADSTSAFAFSWHSEGRYSVYHDAVVTNSYGVLGARGVYNNAYNIASIGSGRGVMFYEYGEGDGRQITVSNFNLKELVSYAIFNRGNAVNDAVYNSAFEIVKNKIVANASTATENLLFATGTQGLNDTLVGTADNDRLLGGKGNDLISGGAGNDYISGGVGADTLIGGTGSDRFAYLNINESGDTILDFAAGKGGDVIDLSAMALRYGWKGDLFAGGYVRFVQSGANALVQVDTDGGGNGYSTLATLNGVSSSALTPDNVSLTLLVTDYSGVTSSAAAKQPASSHIAGDGYLVGTSAADTITGGKGNDVLLGGLGADTLIGGAGTDIASYEKAAGGVTASLENPIMNTGEAAGDTYSQIEGLKGSAYSDMLFAGHFASILDGGDGNDLLTGLDGTDTLYGGNGNDTLYGGTKSDALYGGNGADFLDGGEGYDTLTGGAGADVFAFSIKDGTYDTITDFQHGIDDIGVNAASFGIKTSSFKFVTDKAQITTTDPTFYYDASHQTLWLDVNGSASGGLCTIAKFTTDVGLTATDIILL